MDPEWTGSGQGPRGSSEGTLAGPLDTARYEDRLYAARPRTLNVQLLWYRSDLVSQAAEDLGRDDLRGPAASRRKIEVQAARYEGFVVWFNSLVASAGGEIVDDAGDPVLGAPAVEAAEIMKRLATLVGRAPGA